MVYMDLLEKMRLASLVLSERIGEINTSLALLAISLCSLEDRDGREYQELLEQQKALEQEKRKKEEQLTVLKRQYDEVSKKIDERKN